MANKKNSGIMSKISDFFDNLTKEESASYSQKFEEFLQAEQLSEQELWELLEKGTSSKKISPKELQKAIQLHQHLKAKKKGSPELQYLLQNKQFKSLLDSIRETCQTVIKQAGTQGITTQTVMTKKPKSGRDTGGRGA